MASKIKTPVVAQPASLTAAQMSAAIPRIQRRIAEMENLNWNQTPDEISVIARNLYQKYEDLIVGLFGVETVEFKRYHMSGFYDASPVIVMGFGGRGTTRAEEIEPYQSAVSRALNNLKTIVEIFEEKLDDGLSQPFDVFRALGSLDLHPEIADAVVELFRGGHYANAVEDACKALDLLVKLKSKRSDPSGTDLMRLVFSTKSPILKFNEQEDQSERSEQEGMLHLYAGAMLAFRNPRAHSLVSDDPVEALEIVGFVNFLAKALSRTKRAA
jgi:uncharacterized protein (TIGR02391 family)